MAKPGNLGIDLGTSTVLAARWLAADSAPTVFDLQSTTSVLSSPKCYPSEACYIPASREVVVGTKARQAYLASGGTGLMFPSAKRYLRYCGTPDALPTLPPNLQNHPWPLPEMTGDQVVSPFHILEALIVDVLKRLREAGAAIGERNSVIRVGCPGEWGLETRQQLRDMVQRHVQTHISLGNMVDEALLGGLCYFFYHPEAAEGRYLVFDFGGGTFDSAWIEYDGPSLPLRMSACLGVPELGGDDLDTAIAQLIELKCSELLRMAPEELHVLAHEVQPSVGKRWEWQAEETKRLLGTRSEIRLSALLPDQVVRDTSQSASILITRDEVARVITRYVLMACDCLDRLSRQRAARSGTPDNRRTIRQCQSELQGIIMTGGMAKMPLLREMIAERVGSIPLIEVARYPEEESVVRGAVVRTESSCINVHRLGYGIAVEFVDGENRPVGSHELLGPYEAIYDREQQRLRERKKSVEIPPGACFAYLIIQDGFGNRTSVKGYQQVNIGATPLSDWIKVNDGRKHWKELHACLEPTGMVRVSCTDSSASRAEYWPLSLPWLGGDEEQLLRDRLIRNAAAQKEKVKGWGQDRYEG